MKHTRGGVFVSSDGQCRKYTCTQLGGLLHRQAIGLGPVTPHRPPTLLPCSSSPSEKDSGPSASPHWSPCSLPPSQMTSSMTQYGNPPPISWFPRTPFGPCRAVRLGMTCMSSLSTILVLIPHIPQDPAPCNPSPSRGPRRPSSGTTSAACPSMPSISPPYELRKGLYHRHPILTLLSVLRIITHRPRLP